MIQFKLPSMTCGHCAGRVQAALRAADPDGRIEIDLAARTVSVDADADRETLARALAEAGYPVE